MMKNKALVNLGAIFLAILSLYFLAKFVNEVKSSRFIGSGTTATNTISVSGEGDVYAAPDIAAVTFSVQKDDVTVAGATKLVDDAMNSAIAMIKTMGVALADIQLQDNSFNPKYDYGVPCYGGAGMPCVQAPPKIIGYTASRSVTIKIRKLDDAGAIVQAISGQNVTDLNGPTFSIENEDAVHDAAREKAIADAKAKAQKLASDLGVTLIRIVNFSESGDTPSPIMPMYAKAMSAGAPDIASAPPVLPAGENHYVSNVSNTYEIE